MPAIGSIVAMFAAAVAAVAPSPAGYYESRQAEIGSGLELKPDGSFRYALDYGAVSEIAEGRWASDGHTIWLTSDPLPKAPSFEIVRDDPAPEGQYWVTLEDPGFDWGGPLEFAALFDGAASPVRLKPAADGRVANVTGRIASIQPIVPVYDIVSAPLVLSGPGGHRLTVRFLRNDLGKARFVRQPVTIEDGGLRLDRYETSIRLVRVTPAQ